MRAVVVDSAGKIHVESRPDPVLPGPDGAIVKVEAASICGSDLHFLEGHYPIVDPVSVGHEAVGTIVETLVAGRRVSQLMDGGREVDVNVVAPQTRIESPQDLAAVRFVAPDGRVVALASVARIERTGGPLSIRHLERERNVLFTVNIAPDAPLERVVGEVESQVFPAFAAKLGPSYSLRVGGSAMLVYGLTYQRYRWMFRGARLRMAPQFGERQIGLALVGRF